MDTIAPFEIEHHVAAPRALLWRVITEPEHLSHWLSPAGFHTIHTDMDFRVGGRYFYGIEGPHALQMWGMQQFLDIDPEKRIVHLQSFSTPQGGLGRHPLAADWPSYMHVTTTLADHAEGGTAYRVTWVPHESDAAGLACFDQARAGMQAGFGGTFAKLDAYLAQIQGA